MNEQSYGIPYAMHVHDIEKVGEFYTGKGEVNDNLETGWIMLHIGNDANGDVIYVMGKPRPKFCTGSSFIKSTFHHKPAQMVWDNPRKNWYCPDCGIIK